MPFAGILRRYVFGQVLSACLLAQLTITIIFVLFVVMAEATRQGLSPQEVLSVIPYIVPGSLPYTIPVSLLFAVSVAYGRLAGDNEVIAAKAAGLHPFWALIGPSLVLGIALSGLLFGLSTQVIPRSNRLFKQVLIGNVEEAFYRFLKKERELNNPKMPFYIKVRDIDGRTLIDPTFKHRVNTEESADKFDCTVQADRATIQFDLVERLVKVELENATITGSARPFVSWIDGKQVLQYQMPAERASQMQPRVQELTDPEIAREQAGLRRNIARERKRQATAALLQIGAGRLGKVDWVRIGSAYRDYEAWQKRWTELETERYQRVATAGGPLFFALVGAPVGILFARRDFLSAFMSCFLPIIMIYYPLILVGMNLSKEGFVPPLILFAGDFVLGIASGFVVWRVVKH